MFTYPNSLCPKCSSVRKIENKRGSVFFMCGRSKEDNRFPKYPPQPVVACPGFEEKATQE